MHRTRGVGGFGVSIYRRYAGFLAYEMGASRSKNALAAGVKNILALAVIIPTFYLFGWWIYNAFPGGMVPVDASSSLP